MLKKQDPVFLTAYDLSSLKASFLASERRDEPTAAWIADAIKRPIMASCNGVEPALTKFGSPAQSGYGVDIKLIDDITAAEITEPGKQGVIAVEGPLPPGCLQTICRDDERFVKTYGSSVHNKVVCSTIDWGVRDADGYFWVQSRTEDVINVAAVAVVGLADPLKGQVAMAFAVLKQASRTGSAAEELKLEGES